MAKGRDYRDYLEALGKSYEKNGMKSQWEHLMEIAEGVSPADRAALLAEYPELPLALLGLLERIDGVLFSREDRCLIFCPPSLGLESYSVPEGTLKISDS
ncbi:MAG: hypothetical protein IIY70_02980, partial [Oscillospiraceae bacterium]|nr:hypothetical protein [Oscillospiraceae bacterium]